MIQHVSNSHDNESARFAGGGSSRHVVATVTPLLD